MEQEGLLRVWVDQDGRMQQPRFEYFKGVLLLGLPCPFFALLHEVGQRRRDRCVVHHKTLVEPAKAKEAAHFGDAFGGWPVSDGQ